MLELRRLVNSELFTPDSTKKPAILQAFLLSEVSRFLEVPLRLFLVQC